MSIVARRYAKALYEEAERQAETEAVDRDVEAIRESLEGSSDLVRFFTSPIISREKKAAVVATLFAERVQPLTVRFLQLLIEKEREGIFSDVVRVYREMKNQRLGVVNAHVRVAHVLPDDEVERLVRTIEKLTGKSVRLEIEYDERLIGGVVIRIGDTVYDGSIRHHLDRLRERLDLGSYVLN